MRFGVETKFRVVEDDQGYPDPWAFGFLLLIHRYDSKQHQRWVKARQREDPLLCEVTYQMAHEQLSDESGEGPAAEAAKEATATPAAEGAPDLQAEVRQDFAKRWMSAFRRASLAKLEQDREKAFSLIFDRNDRLEEALDLLFGWRNLTDENGEDVPYDAAAKRQLLTSEVLISEGYGSGKDLGEALVDFVLEKATESTKRRQKYLEAAEKNSAGSSAGA